MLAGTVMLGDLDDFIAPAQACVNPLFADAVNAKPVADADGAPSAPSPNRGLARVAIASDFLATSSAPAAAPKRPDLIKLGEGKTARVSLNDCLACSGCVTSAETILITQQSAGEMLRALADPAYAAFVISFSPQALASLAAHFGIASTLVAYRKLAAYFHGLGFAHVVDTAVCGELALAEACDEFVARLRRRPDADASSGAAAAASARGPPPLPPQSPAPWVAPPATVALSSTRLQAVTDTTADGVAVATGEPVAADAWDAATGGGRDGGAAAGPLLASACPGWVCYAEKTVPEALPYMSRVRSPQQLTGAVVKQLLSRGALLRPGGGGGGGAGDRAIAPSAVYHVTVMPCYDKKLEASRRDFWWDGADGGDGGAGGGGAREVDCVVTAGEVADLLAAAGVHLADVPEDARVGNYDAPPGGVDGGGGAEEAAPPPSSSSSSSSLERLLTGVTRDGASLVGPCAAAASSDAFLQCALRAAAVDVHGAPDFDAVAVEFEAGGGGRNADFREAVARAAPGGPVVARGALAYGFRNIQTVVTRMKRGRAPWDYVEIMACPSGCANGGGQAKAGAAAAAHGGEAAPTAEGRREAADAGKARVADVLGRLHARAVAPRPGTSPAAAALRAALRACTAPGDLPRLLRTRYHHVPKLEAAAIKW